jgi:hypothetical protein
MASFRRAPPVHFECVADRPVQPSATVSRAPGGGWLLTVPGETLVLLGPQLEERSRFPLPTRWFAPPTVSPDGQRAYLSLSKSIRCITPKGETVWEVPHPPWGKRQLEGGSCWLSPDARQLWVTTPQMISPDLWWVLDASSGALQAQALLPSRGIGSRQVGHPDGAHVGLVLMTAENELQVYWGRREGDRVSVQRIAAPARGLLDVRPDGAQFLTMLRGPGHPALAALPFPDGPPVARREAKDTFAEVVPDERPGPPFQDPFSGWALYVTQDLILTSSEHAGTVLLLSAGGLDVVGEPEYAGKQKGRIAATDQAGHLVRYDSDGLMQLWALRR